MSCTWLASVKSYVGYFDGIFDITPDHSLECVVPLNSRCEFMPERNSDRFTLVNIGERFILFLVRLLEPYLVVLD